VPKSARNAEAIVGKARDIAARKVGLAGSTAAHGAEVIYAIEALSKKDKSEDIQRLRELLNKSIEGSYREGIKQGWIMTRPNKQRPRSGKENNAGVGLVLQDEGRSENTENGTVAPADQPGEADSKLPLDPPAAEANAQTHPPENGTHPAERGEAISGGEDALAEKAHPAVASTTSSTPSGSEADPASANAPASADSDRCPKRRKERAALSRRQRRRRRIHPRMAKRRVDRQDDPKLRKQSQAENAEAKRTVRRYGRLLTSFAQGVNPEMGEKPTADCMALVTAAYYAIKNLGWSRFKKTNQVGIAPKPPSPPSTATPAPPPLICIPLISPNKKRSKQGWKRFANRSSHCSTRSTITGGASDAPSRAAAPSALRMIASGC
jgi:hypothetical protein